MARFNLASLHTLTRVEVALRALKSDLGLRLFTARSLVAHLLISVLACHPYPVFHLNGAITYELFANSDARHPSTILEQLSTKMRATITLADAERKVHHLRFFATPFQDQHQTFGSLGINPLTQTSQGSSQFVVL